MVMGTPAEGTWGGAGNVRAGPSTEGPGVEGGARTIRAEPPAKGLGGKAVRGAWRGARDGRSGENTLIYVYIYMMIMMSHIYTYI